MGKKINMSAQFNRDLKALSRENKQEFLELVTELIQWPNMPNSRNKEKLNTLPDGPVYSLRVTYHIRILIQELDNETLRFVAIGPHDEVYKRI